MVGKQVRGVKFSTTSTDAKSETNEVSMAKGDSMPNPLRSGHGHSSPSVDALLRLVPNLEELIHTDPQQVEDILKVLREHHYYDLAATLQDLVRETLANLEMA